MDDLHRAAHLDAERQKKIRKFEAMGIEHHLCTICGQSDPIGLVVDHVAGRNHDDSVRLLCESCDAIRTADQRCDPSPGDNPKNVFEVIGRWLLGIASYFELLTDTLRRFGEFLINLAKNGYGDDLSFDAFG
jgi:hypothetical protein